MAKRPGMELPSVTLKKQEAWQQVDEIYNSCYGSLQYAINIVANLSAAKQADALPEHVEMQKLLTMVGNLSRDVNSLRNELNAIYNSVMTDKSDLYELADINMRCISYSSELTQWQNKYAALAETTINDINVYIQGATNNE